MAEANNNNAVNSSEAQWEAEEAQWETEEAQWETEEAQWEVEEAQWEVEEAQWEAEEAQWEAEEAQREAETEEILLADFIEIEDAIEDPDLILEDLDADPTFDGLVDRDTGMGRTLKKLRTTMAYGCDVTGGDLDDNLYQAEVVGEEAVGGQTPTPDQNVTDELLHSMGISDVDGEPVQTIEQLERRDRERWELDPSSSEDISIPDSFNP
ncbi:MAG: DUF6335 family protein [Xenococcaceae cyanobacterium]